MADNIFATKSTGISQTSQNAAARSRRLVQVILIFIMFLCCAASFYFFMVTTNLIEPDSANSYREPPMPDVSANEESKELDKTGSEFSVMERASSVVMQTALLAEVSGKYPVAPMTSLILPSLHSSDASDDGTSEYEMAEVVIEPDPPQVTVVAVMITGNDRVAILDVLGEDDGLVVRQGTNFASDTARVTKIDAKGVTFTWMKKSYTVVM